MHPETPANDPVIACALSPAELEKRADQLSRLVGEAQTTVELDDGFALAFASDKETAARLFGFVIAERRCCPFFRFELVFEPDQGPLRLRLRGPEEAKSLVRLLLAERGEAS